MYGPCFSSIVGGHPLRSPTRHRLGRPLPYQLADGTQVPPKTTPKGAFHLTLLIRQITWGISSPFELVSPVSGQVTNALLTRSPLTLPRRRVPVRLACIRHAASVHPEPGSNSPQKMFLSFLRRYVPKFLFDTGLLVTFQLLRSCLKLTQTRPPVSVTDSKRNTATR